LGGIIASVLDGIERGLDPGAPSEHDPANLSDEERAANNIRRLPTEPEEALRLLEGDSLLMNAMGELMSRSYLAVHRHDNATFAAQDEAFEIANHFYKY
jgi:glutamine synthetase